MGFRNPITSATSVDTGRGLANPGVRLYQDTSVPGVPRGIAEWRTGIMDRNATVTLSGGGSGGSSFVIDGGASAGGTNAPHLEFDVAGAPAGGYQSVLRIAGADVIDIGPVAQLYATAVQSFAASGWQTLTLAGASQDTAGGWSATPASGGRGPDRYVVQSRGDYAIEGVAAIGVVPAGAYAGGRILINGALRPGGPGMIQPTGAISGSFSALTGRKRYTLLAGDVIQLQGFCDQPSWATRMTSSGDGITSQLLIERVG